MFALQRVCRTWSSDSCPVSGTNALRARKLLRKDAPGGFSDLNWKCEVKEHHSHSWLLCTAVLKAQRHWGSQVSEPGLAFWWWLLPLQWEAEIVDRQQSFFFFNVRPHSTTCGILVPWPRIEPTLPMLEGRVLTPGHWGSPGTIIFYLWLGMGRPGFQSLFCYWVTLGRSFFLSGSSLIFKASRLLGHFLGLLWETHHVGSQYHTGLATRPLWIQPALDSIPALYLVGKLLHLPEPLFHSPVNQEKHYPYHTIVQSSNRNLQNVQWLTVRV